LGKSSIWDANEAFYAETPREMLTSGDYLAPHFNFAPRAQKPPLTYWAVLLSYKLFGVREFAVRVPSALAAIGVILFCYGLAHRLFSPQAALIASIIAATTARLFILARRLPIDILLLFFLVGMLFFLVQAIQTRKRRAWACVYLFAGCGFLTKGPVALFIPGVSYLLWALWARRFKWRALYPFMGAAIFMLIALPWYAAIFHRHGWTYIAPFFLRDNLGRFASESLGPSRGIFYYISVGLTDFFPWSILALVGVSVLWIHRKSISPLKGLEFGLPLSWCACTFLLFSLSKNKQEYYIAPMYPAAAVILSGILDKTIRKRATGESASAAADGAYSASPNVGLKSWAPKETLWICAFGLLAFLLFALSLLAPYIFRSLLPYIGVLPRLWPSAVLLAGSMVLAWSLVRRKLRFSFGVLAVSLWMVYAISAWIYLPELEQYRPVKRFCRTIEMNNGKDASAGYFRTALPSMAFYLRRPIFEEYDFEGMKRRLQSQNRVFCIMTERDYNYLAENNNLEIHILDVNPNFSIRFGALFKAGYIPEEDLLLISNRPGSKTDSFEDKSTS
jgi:4-amino-4-deoxy-L-arabinose transferase-like glycosyltransferase